MLEAAASSATAVAKPLELEFGQLFFGYPVVPYTPPATPPSSNDNNSNNAPPRTGANASGTSGSTRAGGGLGLSVMDSLRGGNTLSGRPTPRSSTPASVPEVVVGAAAAAAAAPSGAGSGGVPAAEHDWGSGGHTLGSARSSGVVKKTGTGEKKKKKKKEVIEID